jgi:hypothetical protein
MEMQNETKQFMKPSQSGLSHFKPILWSVGVERQLEGEEGEGQEKEEQ